MWPTCWILGRGGGHYQVCPCINWLIRHSLSDFTQLSTDTPFCVISDTSVSLQFGAGLKQDWLGHVSCRLCFSQAPNELLCLARHLKEYLAWTGPLHSSHAVFVTTTVPHGAAVELNNINGLHYFCETQE